MTVMSYEPNIPNESAAPTVRAANGAAAGPPPKKSYLLAVVMALWGRTLVLAVFLMHRAYGPLVGIPHSASTVY
jgi:hypothetical protein